MIQPAGGRNDLQHRDHNNIDTCAAAHAAKGRDHSSACSESEHISPARSCCFARRYRCPFRPPGPARGQARPGLPFTVPCLTQPNVSGQGQASPRAHFRAGPAGLARPACIASGPRSPAPHASRCRRSQLPALRPRRCGGEGWSWVRRGGPPRRRWRRDCDGGRAEQKGGGEGGAGRRGEGKWPPLADPRHRSP